MRDFSRLTGDQVVRQVRKALEAGCFEDAGELTMWFEQPEANIAVFQMALQELEASRRELVRLCSLPLSQRTAADNAAIRKLGNLWENTQAGRKS